VIGLAPLLFWPAVARAVGDWHPGWAAAEAPAPLHTLALTNAGLAVVLAAAGWWLWRRARDGGLRRGLTWDCAYATPTAHMQYTSGSFAGISAGWFSWILQPAVNLRRPRGPFPKGAFRLEYGPETVLENVIGPAGRAILFVSTAVRRLQHGRLQAYILYLVVGLAALGGLVLLGGVS
jgi:hydrogenase-4 component B